MKKTLITAISILFVFNHNATAQSLTIKNNHPTCGLNVNVTAQDANNAICGYYSTNMFSVAASGGTVFFNDVTVVNGCSGSYTWMGCPTLITSGSQWDHAAVLNGNFTGGFPLLNANCGLPQSNSMRDCAGTGTMTGTWSDDGFGNITITVN